jgi:hypothetical protein
MRLPVFTSRYRPAYSRATTALPFRALGLRCDAMSRIRVVGALASVAGLAGFVLAGCSGTSSSLPSWLQTTPPPPPTQSLQFDSQPPGADVRTADGQTCKTPCTLAVPVQTQTVSFGMNGFVPQSVPVQVAAGSNPPQLQPNPVLASLQALPSPSTGKPKPHKPKPKVAAKPPRVSPNPSIAAPEPASAAPPQDNVFPPPPPMPSPSSGQQ